MKKIFLLLFLFWGAIQAQGAEEENKVALSLVADVESIQPGTPFQVGIYLQIEPGWHTYYKEPGEAGAPPEFVWNLPAGFSVGELQWPKPLTLVEPGNIRVNAYKKELFLWAILIPPQKISDKEVKIQLQAKWLVCEELCIPESGEAELTLPVLASLPVAANQTLFQKFQHKNSIEFDFRILKFLFFAFIGGLILNVMPCVLPVISLKVLSFVKMAHQSRRGMATLGLAFTAGVIASFLFLATLVVVFKQLGEEIGWGFQFQHPEFVIVLTAIIFVLGLSLAGVFELTLSVPQKGNALTRKEGIGGAFFHGVLATILATPCTAPFVGVTIGFAFSTSSSNVFLIFLAMGLGLAFPFLMLALNPAWTRFVPKPGAWMNRFKQAMAFLLFATVVWLLWVLGRQSGMEGVIWTLAFLLCLAVMAWVWGEVQFLERRKKIFWGLGLLLLLLATQKIFIQPLLYLKRPGEAELISQEKIQWVKYDPQQFQQLLKEQKPIFLDFTADWCLTCKINEKRVLSRPDVAQRFRELNIVPIKLDWTFRDPEVSELLKSFGRFGVPLYVYYPQGEKLKPILLPEVLTKKSLFEALKQPSEESK